MPKPEVLDASVSHPEDIDYLLLKENVVAMVSCFWSMYNKLESIQENPAGGKTSSQLKGLSEEHKEELVVFETIKGEIAQALHDISDALIKEIELHWQHVELVQEQLDVPSKEIPHDLPLMVA
ncbi:unnamed protein product [Linum trigynum]|uniref:Uncharacterized protein n=1 Tax=Linum trigynum TaxID=586398 RepID=A0AAV2D4V1_9ROSI